MDDPAGILAAVFVFMVGVSLLSSLIIIGGAIWRVICLFWRLVTLPVRILF